MSAIAKLLAAAKAYRVDPVINDFNAETELHDAARDPAVDEAVRTLGELADFTKRTREQLAVGELDRQRLLLHLSNVEHYLRGMLTPCDNDTEGSQS